MNFHDELELLIRVGYPVLTIISNKDTRSGAAAIEVAAKRRKRSSSGAAATLTSTSALPEPGSVQGAAKR
jgi:hypothetical protein